jgi:ATP-binding cassette subfamily B (MDR/TAP) protein 1
LTLQALSHRLRRDIFNDTLRQDLQFFDRPENNVGALTSRIDAYPQAVFELMGFNIGFILIAAVNVAACSVLGIVYAWKLGVVIVFAGFPAVVVCGLLKMIFDGKMDRDISKRLATSSSIASESVTAIRTVSSLAIEGSVLGRYTTELDRAVAGSFRPLCFMMVWFALTQSTEYWFISLGLW